MKRKISFFLVGTFCLISLYPYAQIIPGASSYEEIAYQLSNTTLKGSARIQGMANAQISLGGDISSALSNPAGLGFYNRSEICISPSINTYSTNSSYQGNSQTSAHTRFNVENFGIAFHSKGKNLEKKFMGGTFAISFSKTNEFNSEVSYNGYNTKNDIIDFFVNKANEQDVDPDKLVYSPFNAYNSFLISEYEAVRNENGTEKGTLFYDRTFFGEFPSKEYPTLQSEQISTRGSQTQWNLSYGVNVSDMFYFGAGLGIVNVKYKLTKKFTETYPTESIMLSSRTIDEYDMDGTGVNATFGVIVRPTNFMTIGASVITPSIYAMSELYTNTVGARYSNYDLNKYNDYFTTNSDIISDNSIDYLLKGNADVSNYSHTNTVSTSNSFISNESSTDPVPLFEYTLYTPAKLNAGTTFFIDKYGLITADVEWVNYKNARLSDPNDELKNGGYNQLIKDTYQNVLNYRIGMEGRIDHIRLRLGYAFYDNPFRHPDVYGDNSKMVLSGGAGYKTNKFYVDLAAINTLTHYKYQPYSLNANFIPGIAADDTYVDTAKFDISDLSFSITAGVYF